MSNLNYEFPEEIQSLILSYHTFNTDTFEEYHHLIDKYKNIFDSPITVNIAVVGPGGCGKTVYVDRLTSDKFNCCYVQTEGYTKKELMLDPNLLNNLKKK